jgi:hypothetical protein
MGTFKLTSTVTETRHQPWRSVEMDQWTRATIEECWSSARSHGFFIYKHCIFTDCVDRCRSVIVVRRLVISHIYKYPPFETIGRFS